MKLSERAVRWIVIGCCAVAAVRIFVFAAAFPFFNNVSEPANVDLVVKYSHWAPPRGMQPFSAESASYFVLYGTPEYLIKPEQYGGEYPPPTWSLSPEARQKTLQEETPFWQSRVNHESGEPPIYYAIAGGWMNLGRAMGLGKLSLLYWVRFLNIAIGALSVWIGFAVARATFAQNQFVHVAVPILLAIWPQSALYSVQADALMPLSFGLAFLGLIKLLKAHRSRPIVAIWTGLAVAATCLIKTSNFPLPIVLTLALLINILSAERGQHHRPGLSNLIIFILCIAVPLGIWFGWNHHNFGDVTATRSKIELLGWTRKSFAEWWSNPIFGLKGLTEFWPALIASFWRGEFVWHLERMASAWSDFCYATITAVMVVTSVVLLLQNTGTGRLVRVILWTALLSFLSIVTFLVLLSISFDFHNCPYPSRDHPYFTSGRLLNAAAVPFFLLFGYVLDQLCSRTRRDSFRWAALGAIAMIVIISQLQLNAPAFQSRYNFFHR